MQIKRQKRKITNESHKSPHHMLIKVKRNRQKNVIITRAVCLFVLSKRTNLVRSLKISRHQTPTGRTELRCTTTLKSVETLTCLKLNKHDLKIYILVESVCFVRKTEYGMLYGASYIVTLGDGKEIIH